MSNAVQEIRDKIKTIEKELGIKLNVLEFNATLKRDFIRYKDLGPNIEECLNRILPMLDLSIKNGVAVDVNKFKY